MHCTGFCLSRRRERAREHTGFSQQRQVQLGESDSESAFMYYTHTHTQNMPTCTHMRVTQCNLNLSNLLLLQHCVRLKQPRKWKQTSKTEKKLSPYAAGLFAFKHLQASDYIASAAQTCGTRQCTYTCIEACVHVYMRTNVCTCVCVLSAISKSPRSLQSLDCAMS